MSARLPDWLDPSPWLAGGHRAEADVRAGLGARELLDLLSPEASPDLEAMAHRARALTQRHFGRTISLYAPLYLSNLCSGGCAYCGFASDRQQPRRRLERPELVRELAALKALGFEEVLLLTGERTPQADFAYLRTCVGLAAEHFSLVAVEAFAMETEEYAELVDAGCTGVTIYQETYEPAAYARLHRWGAKRDFHFRLEAPARALAAGMRTVGLGVLLGLADPLFDAFALWSHAQELQRRYWRAGLSVSFPRLRPEPGGFAAPFAVDERFLARLIFAFRLALPEVPLVLSTREHPQFRDGMAGLGISKMSTASRTTVGGYAEDAAASEGQFEVSDQRGVEAFCAMLRSKNLEPVFKNWDAVYRERAA